MHRNSDLNGSILLSIAQQHLNPLENDPNWSSKNRTCVRLARRGPKVQESEILLRFQTNTLYVNNLPSLDSVR